MADSSGEMPEFVTARDLPEFIYGRTGLRVTRGKIKNASARGAGPPVIGKWGNGRLFDALGSLEWARSNVRPYERRQQRPKKPASERARVRDGSAKPRRTSKRSTLVPVGT